MNIILTGATGFVGAEVLTQLLGRPDVQGVTSLTRRPLAHTHPKLTSIVHADFSRYDDALLARLADHAACVWTLGGKASDAPSAEQYERVTHGYTLALADAWAGSASSARFCYLSGMGADPSESSWLPWQRATRHLKGRTEADLARLSSKHPGFAAHSFRPGGILPRQRRRLVDAALGPIIVGVEVLAAAMIHVALRGAPQATIGNAAIKRIAADGERRATR